MLTSRPSAGGTPAASPAATPPSPARLTSASSEVPSAPAAPATSDGAFEPLPPQREGPMAHGSPLRAAMVPPAMMAPLSRTSSSDSEAHLQRLDARAVALWVDPVIMEDGRSYEAGHAPTGQSAVPNILLRRAAAEIREGHPDWQDSFLDPISYEPLVDPVVTPDGHTYERAQILVALRHSHASPVTNVNFGRPDSNILLRPNRAVAALMAAARREPTPRQAAQTVRLAAITDTSTTTTTPPIPPVRYGTLAGAAGGAIAGGAGAAAPAYLSLAHASILGVTMPPVVIVMGTAFAGACGAVVGALGCALVSYGAAASVARLREHFSDLQVHEAALAALGEEP